MGLLDDAIREHLELKRRSGADPSDIARLELEALGGAQPSAREAQHAGEPEPEPHAQDEAPETFAPEPEQQTRQFSAEEVEAAMDQEPPPAAVPFDADAAPAGDDELAQTPEFLEETPEHERLWFDQKPPKDFDF